MNEKIVKDFLDCYDSLDQAIKQAGGMGIPLSKLRNMSATDLIATIATNGVRFVKLDSDSHTDPGSPGLL